MSFIRDDDTPILPVIALAIVIALLLLVAWVGATTPIEPRTITIGMGELNAAEHELADGYFAIGVGHPPTAIMVAPQSVGWLHLRDLRGQRVTVLVRVE